MGRLALVWIAVGCSVGLVALGTATAQDGEPASAPAGDEAVTAETVPELDVPGPPPEPTAGYDHDEAVGADLDAPAPSRLATSLAALPPPPPPSPDDAPLRGFELSWMASGLLSSGFGPSLATDVGLFFAASPQWWLGPTVGVRFDESVFRSSPTDFSRTTSTTVALGLTLQHYFEEPRTGAVLPTLHATLRGGYTSVVSETVSGAFVSRTSSESISGGVMLDGGATWMPEPWLAGRLMGGLDLGFASSIGNPMMVTTSVVVGARAQIGVVVRL